MRIPGRRPYALQPFILVCSYLGHRQQRMLDLGSAPGRPVPRGASPRRSTFADGLLGAAAGRLPQRRRAAPGPGRRVAADPRRRASAGPRPRAARPADDERYAADPPHGRDARALRVHAARRAARRHLRPRPVRPGGRPSRSYCREFNDLRNDYLPWAATPGAQPAGQRRRGLRERTTCVSRATCSARHASSRTTRPTGSTASRS